MSKKRIIFTNSKQSKRGIMSICLAGICIASLLFSFIFSYRKEGEIPNTFGAGLFVTFVMAVAGLILGVNSRLDQTKHKLFPTIGIVLNVIVIIVLGILLSVGLR